MCSHVCAPARLGSPRLLRQPPPDPLSYVPSRSTSSFLLRHTSFTHVANTADSLFAVAAFSDVTADAGMSLSRTVASGGNQGRAPASLCISIRTHAFFNTPWVHPRRTQGRQPWDSGPTQLTELTCFLRETRHSLPVLRGTTQRFGIKGSFKR